MNLILLLILLPSLTNAKTFSFVPFTREGNVAITSHVVKCHLSVNLGAAAEACRHIQKTMETARTAKLIERVPSRAASFKHAEARFQHFCDSSLNHIISLPQQTKKRRSFLLALGLGAAATWVASHLFPSHSHDWKVTKHNIRTLDEEVKELQKHTNQLSYALNMLNTEVKTLKVTDQLIERILNAEHKLSRYEDAIIQLIQGKLTHSIISIPQANALIQELDAKARKMKAFLPFDTPLALYSLPVHHEQKGQNFTFSFNIPFIQKELSQFRLIQAPIFIPRETGPRFIVPLPSKTILVSSEMTENYALSSSALDRCIKWEATHFCSYLPPPSPLDKCLIALFYEPHVASSICDFTIPKFSDVDVMQLDDNSYLLSVNVSSITTKTSCPSGHSSQQIYKTGQYLIENENNCVISSSFFSLPAFSFSSRVVVAQPVHFDESALQPPATNPAFPFTTLQHKALQTYTETNWMSHLPAYAAMVSGTIVLVVALVFGLRFYLQRKNLRLLHELHNPALQLHQNEEPHHDQPREEPNGNTSTPN